MSNKIFQFVAGLTPSRSAFDLSYDKLFNCNMGELIPVVCDEVVPGDIISIGNEIVVRMQPMVAPVLHTINVYVHYFFVPTRITWDSWEEFITGGVDGNDNTALPLWQPTNLENPKYSAWDYLGFPIAIDFTGITTCPVDFPKRAINKIWNDWYRDETIQTELGLDDEIVTPLLRNWPKDYFTSALEDQQRGTALALPVSGTTNAEWPAFSAANLANVTYDTVAMAPGSANDKTFLEGNTVDLSSATTFDVADLRLVIQIQKWMERNARAGVRYCEFLRSHFNCSPTDERLDRAEWIGGTKQPIIVSEVLQTSASPAAGAVESDTPLGTLGGHGISAAGQFAGKYRVEEFGIIVGLLSIMPTAAYSQGINRQWLKQTRYDYYFPEFQGLSEQAITTAEIYFTANDNNNNVIFGYQGRYDELRQKTSMYVSDFRDTFDYWHLGRVFGGAPQLDESFIQCVPDTRIFAVEDEPGFLVHIQNNITALRPLPIQSNPGLMDHF